MSKHKEEDDLRNPFTHPPLGFIACDIIRTFLVTHDLIYTGGCRAFYTPHEWQNRGEKGGAGAELIIAHDGGDLSYLLREPKLHHLLSSLTDSLEKAGLYLEPINSWSTAVYRI